MLCSVSVRFAPKVGGFIITGTNIKHKPRTRRMYYYQMVVVVVYYYHYQVIR